MVAYNTTVSDASTEPNDPPRLAIEAFGLTKFFGITPALRGVDLELPWGEALALFGHNGAGKSTLLRTLCTLVRPNEGRLSVSGFAHDKQASLVRSVVGYVGHQALLYDDLTPRENLTFYAKLYGLSEAADRIATVMRDVGAEAWADRRVRTLSNGMQKRVAIARALLHRPRVLLLDEPETGLDEGGLALLEQVVQAVKHSGASVVLSTHDIDRGLGLSDRVMVLAGGRVAMTCMRIETSSTAIQAAVTGLAEKTR
jgi:heme ABC exporter ATP-binding subunit CcmA